MILPRYTRSGGKANGHSLLATNHLPDRTLRYSGSAANPSKLGLKQAARRLDPAGCHELGSLSPTNYIGRVVERVANFHASR